MKMGEERQRAEENKKGGRRENNERDKSYGGKG